jgi:hypothetical protein
MSRRTRALIVGATLVAMQLAAMTAVAHAQAIDEPTNSHDTRRPPTQGQVGEAWRQPREAADAPAVAGDARRPPTESQVGESWRHQTSVPGAIGRAGRAARLAHRLAGVPGRSRGPGRRARRTRRQPAQPPTPSRAGALITVTPLDGAAAPTRQPHHLATDELVAYPARGRGVLSVRWSGGNLRAHYLAPDGRAPPAKTQGCTAVSARLLIRMRSQVQVLAGPPPIPAGQSAVGSEPGRLAASLGRAGAAPPSPPASPSALPGPPTRTSGATTTTHRGRAQPRTAATPPVRQPRAAACSVPTAQPPATGAPHAGLACLVGQRASAAATART